MRYVFAFPLMAIILALFVVLVYTAPGTQIEPESLVYDGFLPSTAEFFLKAGEVLTAGGILLLVLSAWRAMKCPAIVAATAVLCCLTAISRHRHVCHRFPLPAAPTFFFLMLLAIAEALIAIIAYARAAEGEGI